MKYLCNVSDIKINLRNLKSVLTGISVPMIVVHSFRNKDKVLGVIIVNTLILGEGNSLKSAAEDVMERGTGVISSSLDFSGVAGG